MSDLPERDTGDLWLALFIGAGIALFILLPASLRIIGIEGAGVGAALGLVAALVRRAQATVRPLWTRSVATVLQFIVGSAVGFMLIFWLASVLPHLMRFFGK